MKRSRNLISRMQGGNSPPGVEGGECAVRRFSPWKGAVVATALTFVVGAAAVPASAVPAAAPQAPSLVEPPLPLECPSQGRVFQWSNPIDTQNLDPYGGVETPVRLMVGGETSHTIRLEAPLPAGTYTGYVSAFDGYPSRPSGASPSQGQESFAVAVNDAGGTQDFVSGLTPDLGAGASVTWRGELFTVTTEGPVVEIELLHSSVVGRVDGGSSHSVIPSELCLVAVVPPANLIQDIRSTADCRTHTVDLAEHASPLTLAMSTEHGGIHVSPRPLPGHSWWVHQHPLVTDLTGVIVIAGEHSAGYMPSVPTEVLAQAALPNTDCP